MVSACRRKVVLTVTLRYVLKSSQRALSSHTNRGSNAILWKAMIWQRNMPSRADLQLKESFILYTSTAKTRCVIQTLRVCPTTRPRQEMKGVLIRTTNYCSHIIDSARKNAAPGVFLSCAPTRSSLATRAQFHTIHGEASA